MKRAGLLFFLLVILTLLNCGDSPIAPTRKSPDLSLTPMEDYEAETAAYFLSDELVAPVWLYNKLKSELELIREEWSDSVSAVLIKYTPFAIPSYILAGFDQATLDSILDSTYHAWDSLNELYRVESIANPVFNAVSLRSEGRINPVLLVRAYAGLPGMQYVHTSGWIGDRPLLFLVMDRRTIKYFFREAWGDCPSGCIYSRYHYFVVEDSISHYVGSYARDWNNQEPPPPWMDTAIQARRDFTERQLEIWRRDTIPPTYTCDTLSIHYPDIQPYSGTEEANLAALYLSDSLNPPKALHNRIKMNLDFIRSNRPDSAWVVDTIKFQMPWMPNSFLAHYDNADLEDTTSQAYWYYRCLNEHFFGHVWIQDFGNGWHKLHTGSPTPHLHPKVLIETYTVVPFIDSMKASMSYDLVSDIYVLQREDSIDYYFKDVWGLAPPPEYYKHEKFYYFVCSADSCIFVGSYEPNDGSNPPGWFAACEQARADKFRLIEWVRP